MGNIPFTFSNKEYADMCSVFGVYNIYAPPAAEEYWR
jgi:hypothetical protein